MDLVKTVGLRFIRAFVAGGVANMIAIIASNGSISSLKDGQMWFLSLGVAFITGGLMAIDKLLRTP